MYDYYSRKKNSELDVDILPLDFPVSNNPFGLQAESARHRMYSTHKHTDRNKNHQLL